MRLSKKFKKNRKKIKSTKVDGDSFKRVIPEKANQPLESQNDADGGMQHLSRREKEMAKMMTSSKENLSKGKRHTSSSKISRREFESNSQFTRRVNRETAAAVEEELTQIRVQEAAERHGESGKSKGKSRKRKQKKAKIVNDGEKPSVSASSERGGEAQHRQSTDDDDDAAEAVDTADRRAQRGVKRRRHDKATPPAKPQKPATYSTPPNESTLYTKEIVSFGDIAHEPPRHLPSLKKGQQRKAAEHSVNFKNLKFVKKLQPKHSERQKSGPCDDVERLKVIDLYRNLKKAKSAGKGND